MSSDEFLFVVIGCLVIFVVSLFCVLLTTERGVRRLGSYRKQWRRTTAVADFAATVAQVQSNNSLNAQAKAVIIAEAYNAGMQRMEARGEIIPTIAAEFRNLAETSLLSLASATNDFGHSLTELMERATGYQRSLYSRALRRYAATGYLNHAPLTRSERRADRRLRKSLPR
jgi:hypothetical protein